MTLSAWALFLSLYASYGQTVVELAWGSRMESIGFGCFLAKNGGPKSDLSYQWLCLNDDALNELLKTVSGPKMSIFSSESL